MAWPSKYADQKPSAAELPGDLVAEIDDILSRYPNRRAALVPVLHRCQRHFGYIAEETVVALSERLGLPPSFISDTVSFYTMLRTAPAGKYHIELCQTLSCALLGADSLAAYLTEKLGIRLGEVTPDRKFSLGTVECIGACEQAPAMLVNNELYGNLSRERVDEILDGLP